MSTLSGQRLSEEAQALVATFLDQLQSGAAPDPDEFCRQAGAESKRLRAVLGTVLSLEKLRQHAGDSLSLESSSEPEVPSQFGDFRLLRIAGRGGMATVYEAIELSLGRRVAVKVLNERYAVSPISRERFHREARAAALLHQTNILPVFATGEDHGKSYYVMPFVDGVTLKEEISNRKSQIEKGKLEKNRSYYRRVAEIGLQVAEALRHSYDQGVLHRDVKPSNIMLASDGTVWLTDFGLASVQNAEDLTTTGEILGTLRYLAPERLEGTHTIEGDVFGLGLVLYELLSFKPAYDAVDQIHLHRQVQQASPPALRQTDPSVPIDLETIVMKCMAQNRNDRYAAPNGLMADLRLFLDDRPIASRRISALKLAWRWCSRNPGMASLLATSALLLMIITIGSVLSARTLRRQRNLARQAQTKAVESQRVALAASQKSREAESQARDSLELAKRTERQRLATLFRSMVDQIKVSSQSGRSGRRLRGLEVAQRLLKEIPPDQMTDDQQMELRNAAIGCLSLSDIEELKSVSSETAFVDVIDVDPSFTVLARHSESSEVFQTQLVSLDDGTTTSMPPFNLSSGTFLVFANRRFSPCGRWLSEHSALGGLNSQVLRIFDWPSHRLALELSDPLHLYLYSPSFHPDERRVFIVEPPVINVYDLETGALIRRSPPQWKDASIAFNQEGGRAIVYSPISQATWIDTESFDTLATLPLREPVVAAEWDSSQSEFVVRCVDGSIYRWNPKSAEPRLERGRFGPNVESQLYSDDIRISSDGRRMSSGTLVLPPDSIWNISPGHILRLSPDQKHGAIANEFRVSINRLVESNCFVEVRKPVWYAQFSPSGRWLTVASLKGVQIYDARSLTVEADLGLDPCGPAVFSPSENELVTYGIFSHVCRWPVRHDSVTHQTTIGPPKPVLVNPSRAKLGLEDQYIPQHSLRYAEWQDDGSAFFFSDERGHHVWRVDAVSGEASVFCESPKPAQLDISTDRGVLNVARDDVFCTEVFDLTTKERIAELSNGISSALSSDGRFLATASHEQIRLFDTQNWESIRNWSTDAFIRMPVPMAFQPGTSILAAAVSGTKIRLYDAGCGSQIADLTYPEHDEIRWVKFSDDGSRLVVIRQNSFGVWDLAALNDELTHLGIPTHLPLSLSPLSRSANEIHEKLVIDRGSDLYAANQWWRPYSALAWFEANGSKHPNYPDAIENMQKALKLVWDSDDRSRAEVLGLRAGYYMRSGNYYAALHDLRDSLELVPDDPGSLRQLLNLLQTGPDDLRDPHEAEVIHRRLDHP